MWTIIILAAIGILLVWLSYDNDFWDCLGGSILIGSVFATVGLLIAIASPMKTYEREFSKDIVCLQDNSSVSGTFMLGCGQINGTMKYVLYVVAEDSTYNMIQLDYDLVKIKYTEGKPKLNVFEITKVKNAVINYFALDTDIGDQRYVIEIPKGSIKTDYNLDAK